MKNYLLTLFVCCLLMQVQAQMNYSFTAANASFTPITDGELFSLAGNNSNPISDEGFANGIPLDFTFTYNGNITTDEIGVSTNGFISFATLNSAHLINNLMSGATGQRPIVAALWDDLDLGNTNNISYVTTGTAPNRIFTMQWLNVRWGFGATNAAISFQIKLYEGSNWIQFVYRPENGSPVSPSASVGLTATNSGSNNFLSVGSLSTSPQLSLSAEFNSIAAKPGSGISFTFKPGTLPVVLSSFTVVKQKQNHVVKWVTTQEINNAFFSIERSADGSSFSSIARVASLGNRGNSSQTIPYSFTDDYVLTGTNYYRLKQVNLDGTYKYSDIISIKNEASWQLQLYPNPAKDVLSIKLNNQNSEVIYTSIVDFAGRVVLQNKFSIAPTASFNMDIVRLTAGMYNLQIMNSKGELLGFQQFVKQ